MYKIIKCIFVSLFLVNFLSAEMTLEEKVGQLFIVHGNTEELAVLVKKYHVGGITYYKSVNGLENPAKVRRISSYLQSCSEIPLFVAIDHEGGRVLHLQEGFSELPSASAVARTQDYSLMEDVGYAVGKELFDVGVNVDFAPVVDININPDNPIIGVRSYGSDPEEVSKCAESMMKGMLRAGIIPVIKHFPGHGDVMVDSHKALPIIDKTKEELSRVELVPFNKLKDIAPMIMSAHLLVTAYDKENCATLSPALLKTLLRDEMGYKGLVITDSLTMKGLQVESLGDAAIKAFKAGNDILLIGNFIFPEDVETSFEQTKQAIEEFTDAVRKEEIAEQDVNNAVARILAVKNIGAYQLVESVAKRSVEVVKGKLPLNEDHTIFLTNNAWRDPSQREEFEKIPQDKPRVVIATYDPRDIDIFQDADVLIRTYSPTRNSIKAAKDWLDGTVFNLPLSDYEIEEIGQKIWMNEGGKDELLTFWSSKEDFPSMGIGHFIWPTKEYKGPFGEGRFYKVLLYFQEHGVELPGWLGGRYCPWQTREEFYKNINSEEMQQLRSLLKNTTLLQAKYIKESLDKRIVPAFLTLPLDRRQHVINQYCRLASCQKGYFALIDYSNFKGLGIDMQERYQEQGWGLLQVLEGMPSEGSLEDFIDSAKKVLRQRVDNAPSERQEARWLEGWFNRLNRYL
jgi:beta-N-acetylhexosaminidase